MHDFVYLLHVPIARQIDVSDVMEKESGMGREDGQTVVVEAQCLQVGQVP